MTWLPGNRRISCMIDMVGFYCGPQIGVSAHRSKRKGGRGRENDLKLILLTVS